MKEEILNKLYSYLVKGFICEYINILSDKSNLNFDGEYAIKSKSFFLSKTEIERKIIKKIFNQVAENSFEVSVAIIENKFFNDFGDTIFLRFRKEDIVSNAICGVEDKIEKLAGLFVSKAIFDVVDDCKENLSSEIALAENSKFFKSLDIVERKIFLEMLKLISFNIVSPFTAALSNMTSLFYDELELLTSKNELLNEEVLLNDYLINIASSQISWL